MRCSISLVDDPGSTIRPTIGPTIGLGLRRRRVRWRELRSAGRRSGCGNCQASRLPRRRAGLRVLGQEAHQCIIDRIELMLGAGVQVSCRLGLGKATRGDGLQYPPLLAVPFQSHAPVRTVALTPVCGAIDAQDLRRILACPAQAKRVQGERGSADNQHPTDEVVPSGLQELDGGWHWGSTLDGFAKADGGRALWACLPRCETVA